MNGQLEEKVLDRTVAMARVGGDVELLREISALFLDEYPRVLITLHQALAEGDSKTFERAAHGLKGSVANFGARAAVDAAFRLERLGHDQKLGEVSQALASLELALEDLRNDLRTI